jgi:hypothetical protein
METVAPNEGTLNGGQFRNIDTLRVAVEQHQDVLTVSMLDLREAVQAGRLGQRVLGTISRALAGRGLGHVPQDLPNYQDREVRVYKLGSPVAEVIEAALQPGDDQDELLREAATREASLTLNKIRDLVCK